MSYIGNAPYQGVLTGGNIQDGTVETTDLADSAVTTVKLADTAVTAGKLASTLDLTGKTVTLPAGVGGHASGTTANRPASPSIGTIYFNTNEDTLQQYTSTGWKNIGLIPPAIASISGNIYNTIATNLTISGGGFGVGATVRFSYGGSTSDVSVTPSSDTEITVAVPSAVYGQSVGTSVTISVIAGGQVSNGSSKTVTAVPTGGTITTSGGYLYHTFTSSSSFVVPSGMSVSAEYLIVAGGGSGGVWSETGSGYQDGNKGTNSSFNSQTAIGGGGGRAYNRPGSTKDGGSGGGGGGGSATGAGSGTSGQGNAGGNAVSGGETESGGGGGAGAAGQAGSSKKMGDGGAGINWKSLGTFYAGGGGGGGSNGSGKVRGLGGAGGGGAGGVAGSDNPLPVSGSENKGGGGGGADGWWGQNHGGGGAGGYIDSSATLAAGTYVVTVGVGGTSVGYPGPATVANKNVLSGAGGSGIVIVRYQL